jgi:F0F1-type ATP synthase assembly protein I
MKKAEKQLFEANSLLSIGMYLFTRLTLWLVIPILLAVFAGKYLDKKYDTEPWLFLACVGVAFIFTNIGIIKETFKVMRIIDKESSNNSNKENQQQ